jgi:hypothetical protein
MAKGLKIAHKETNGTLHSQRITTTTTQGAVGGIPQWITGTGTRTLKVQYRTTAGVLHANAYIISQKGSKQFLVANAVGAVEGFTHSNASVTVCTLAAGSDAANGTPSSSAATMAIVGNTTAGTPFYASRITNKYVYDQSGIRYRYRWAATQVTTSTFANVVVH